MSARYRCSLARCGQWRGRIQDRPLRPIRPIRRSGHRRPTPSARAQRTWRWPAALPLECGSSTEVGNSKGYVIRRQCPVWEMRRKASNALDGRVSTAYAAPFDAECWPDGRQGGTSMRAPACGRNGRRHRMHTCRMDLQALPPRRASPALQSLLHTNHGPAREGEAPNWHRQPGARRRARRRRRWICSPIEGPSAGVEVGSTRENMVERPHQDAPTRSRNGTS